MRKQISPHLTTQSQVKRSLFRVYGHTQEFVSYDFYENMIRYAIENNLLDTNLAREPW